jgi:hypothetical protein
LAESSSNEECLAVSSEGGKLHISNIMNRYQYTNAKLGRRTTEAGLKKLDSILAVLRALTQPFDLRDLLQHMNAEILVQFPRRLRSRQELAGYLGCVW